jgi:hypothetical protein
VSGGEICFEIKHQPFCLLLPPPPPPPPHK